MIPLLVINLNKRTDRWDSLSAHIEEWGDRLSFLSSIQRVEAVEKEYAQHITGAHACMLSHAKALRIAKDQGWEKVMVAEDDIRFSADIKSSWETLQHDLNSQHWSVLFGASVQVRPRDLKKVSPHLFQLKSNGILTGTHCMVYHSRAYDTLIKLIETETQQSDPYHLDLLMSLKLNSTQHPIVLAHPFLALFNAHDTSDVRFGTNTQTDYDKITMAQHLMQQME